MRVVVGIEYNGASFYGWQNQANLPTVQGAIEAALSKVADEPIIAICAGRTDAGVHAIGQVAHFETKASRSLRAWVMGANTYLPPAISVRWAAFVEDDFHARFSAIARRYHYVIYNAKTRPALLSSRVTWFYEAIDIARIQTATQYLIGEHDFSAFRSAECESKTAMRNMHFIEIMRQGDYVVLKLQANAFLHHMVRNIVGVLYEIGTGKKDAKWAKTVLESKDRTAASITAPPDGLYLAKVEYPAQYMFPVMDSLLLF